MPSPGYGRLYLSRGWTCPRPTSESIPPGSCILPAAPRPKASVFGSVLRVDFTDDSDIDVLVESGRPVGYREALSSERPLRSLNGLVDVVVGVRRRDEQGLEGRRGQVDTHFQHVVEELRKAVFVGR